MAAEDIQELCFSLHPTFISHTILPSFFCEETFVPSGLMHMMICYVPYQTKNSYQSVWCGKIFPHHKFMQGLFIPCTMLENALEPSVPPKQNRINK
jgi:hypothetical protein